MANFLNTDGLSALWAKIKSKFYTKTEIDAAIPSASTTAPLMDGTASYGSGATYARADHVHPTDTSRAAVSDVLTKTNTTSFTPSGDYNPATKKYVDDSISGFSTTLSGLTDITISSASNGQVLKYDSATSKWVNSAEDVETYYVTITDNGNGGYTADKTFDDTVAAYNAGKVVRAIKGTELFDLSMISPSNGMGFSKNNSTTLKYYTWTKSSNTISYSGIVAPNTNISSPQNGQVLSYDSASSKWINTTLNSGVTETRVNELIAAALAQYGDGDTASYGYTDASEVNY